MDEDDTSLEGSDDIEEDSQTRTTDETNVPLINPTSSSVSTGDEETTSTYRDVPLSPAGDDDVFDDAATTPSDTTSTTTTEADKNVTQAKQRWIRFAKGTMDKKGNEEERIELEKLPGIDGKGRPNRLAIRKQQRRKRAQSIFLDNQEHMVFKPSTSRMTPATPDSQFANLVVNLMAQKRTDEVQTPGPMSAGNSLKERQQQFEWSIKTTREVVKEKTEELKRTDDPQKEKKTLRDLTMKVTQRLKDEKEPRMANIVGQVMKMASSAPTSFESDSDQEENFRPRAQSTATGNKAKRRPRRISTSSNVLLQKFMDRSSKRSKPTAVKIIVPLVNTCMHIYCQYMYILHTRVCTQYLYSTYVCILFTAHNIYTGMYVDISFIIIIVLTQATSLSFSIEENCVKF